MTREDNKPGSLGRRAAMKVIGLLGTGLLAPQLAKAQQYPTKPLRLIVPYTTGGSADVISRPFAEHLGARLGQQVVVDNRPGAATNIGNALVARGEPDGHTLLFGTNALTQNGVFGPQPPFDVLNALSPISTVSSAPFMLAVRADSPIGNLAEYVANGRQAKRLTLGSAQLDVFVELLKMQAGVDLLHVPYKGGGVAITDLLGGQIDSIYSLAPALMSYLDSGRMRALAIGSTKRMDRLPDVPTFQELGVGHEAYLWFGVLAPSGTPPAIIARLARATDEVVRLPEFSARIRATGSIAESATPEEFAEKLRGEVAFWEKTAKKIPQLVRSEKPK